MAGIISRLLGFFGRGKQPKATYEVADVYQGLRQQILTLDPHAARFEPSPSGPVWAVLMETGFTNAVVTLVAVCDGTVSLYFSNGGGTIGLGQHEGPREAGAALLAAAPAFLPQTTRTTDFPLPAVGYTTFYLMTLDGVFTATALEDDLGNERHALSPLFYQAQEVITQIRMVDEQRQETGKAVFGAATSGDVEALDSMLKSGVDVDTADETGLTPLMASAFAGMAKTMRLLLNSGAAIEATDSSGYTALMFACNAGKTDCARILIERGADINHGDNDASTPLMFATQHGHNEIVRLLLAKGADPQAKGKHGLSAIGFAQQNGLTETERILRGGE